MHIQHHPQDCILTELKKEEGILQQYTNMLIANIFLLVAEYNKKTVDVKPLTKKKIVPEGTIIIYSISTQSLSISTLC